MPLNRLILLLFIAFCSCKSSEDFLSKRYNLKGSVNFISEKRIGVFCDSANQSTLLLDSCDITFRNYFFSKDGKVLKWENYDKDSTLISYDDYIYSESGKFLKLNSYKNRQPDYYVIVHKNTGKTVITHTINSNTNEFIAIFRIHLRGSTIRIRSHDFVQNNRQVTEWEVDSHGNEIKVKRKTSVSPPTEWNIFYQDVDSQGNWTQRYEVDFDNGECYLVIRRFKYY